MNIDSGLYFIGGSGISCGMGVSGNFKPGFLFLLAIADIVLILNIALLLTSNSLKTRHFLFAALCCTGLFIVNIYWYQPRLFEGYELTENMNILDAVTGKCYLYHGSHDMLLLLVIAIGVTTIFINQKLKY